MSYRMSAKNRKIKRLFGQVFSILKFEGLNIANPLKIVIIGVFLASFGLFLNWIESYDNVIYGNAFYKILGISGYILLFLNIKIFFLVFGQKSKEFIKNIFNFNAKDSILIVILLVFGLVSTINGVFIIENTQMFREGMIIGKGVIMTLVGYTLGLVGGSVNLYSKSKVSIYVENGNGDEILSGEPNTHRNENNMKLPF
ncbi:MAG: hypothetical protein AB7E37_04635 [Candidatus Altimarinota bacterium]